MTCSLHSRQWVCVVKLYLADINNLLVVNDLIEA